MADETVEEFKSSLTDLTFNSKPLINMLTMLAEENVQHAEQIVKVIEEHIQKAASSHKLPALYLIDSIIKNISNSNYLSLFTKNIAATFVVVFERGDEKTRHSMFKLRQTWNDLFPSPKLYTLDVKVNHIDPAWPITAQPNASIHVNPKFLMKQSKESDAPTLDTSSLAVSNTIAKDKHTASVTQPKRSKVKESTVPKETLNEDMLRRDMMAKKQELLRIEQQKIDLQLAEARAGLELQAKKLAALQAAKQESALIAQQQLPPSVSNLRDPRVKNDPTVITSTASHSSHQLAVVLPTQMQSSALSGLTDSVSRSLQCSGTELLSKSAINSTVASAIGSLKVLAGQPLVTSGLSVTALPGTSSVTAVPSTVATTGNIFDRMLDLVAVSTTRNEHLSQQHVSPPAVDTVLTDVKQQSTSCEQVSASVETGTCRNIASPTPTPAAGSGDANDELDSPSKKSDESHGGQRHTLAGRRRTSSYDKKHGGTFNKKGKDLGPAAKKVKQENDGVAPKLTEPPSSSISSDLEELFGNEDQDLRLRPPTFNERQPLLGIAPDMDSLLPHPKTWSSFPADHADAFPSNHLGQMRRADLSSNQLSSMKQPLLPTPLRDDGPDDRHVLKKQPLLTDHKLTDVWPGKDDSEAYPSGSLHPAVRRPILMQDSNSRSPLRHDDRSPRYDDVPMHSSLKTSLLGDLPAPSRFGLPNPSSFKGPNEPKALLPAPPMNVMRMGYSDLELWDTPIKPNYDEEHFYVPEYDVRWCVRAQFGDRSTELFTVIINDRPYEMALDRPRQIQCQNTSIRVLLDSRKRELQINGVGCYRFGCPCKEIMLPNMKGTIFRVFVRGPEKKLWIDDHLFEINVDSPPERIIIGGKEHEIAIDGAAGRIIVDSFDICPFGGDEEQMVQLAFVLHKITFKPPQKQILIDGNLCSVDLSGKFPVIWIANRPRGIRFDGEPREIFIDDKPWVVPMNSARKCRIDGPKPRLLAFGGPGHEVIIDDQWFEVKFGGEAKIVKFGGGTHKIQLRGNPPEVKILPEVIAARDLIHSLKDRNSARQPDFRSNVDNQILPPPPIPLPALLDLKEPCVQADLASRDPRIAHNNFSGPDDARRPAALIPGMQRVASASALSRVPDQNMPLLRPPWLQQQSDKMNCDTRLLPNGQPIVSAPGMTDANNFRQDQFHPIQSGLSAPYQGVVMQGATRAQPLPNAAPSIQPLLQLNITPSSTAQNMPSSQPPQTPGGMVDVNLLLTQLLAKGLIGQTPAAVMPAVAPAAEPAAPLPPTTVEDTAAAQQTSTAPSLPLQPTSITVKGPVTAELKEIARKQEELIESIPPICDFEVEKLRKYALFN